MEFALTKQMLIYFYTEVLNAIFPVFIDNDLDYQTPNFCQTCHILLPIYCNIIIIIINKINIKTLQ
jgi:hypothetical protein